MKGNNRKESRRPRHFNPILGLFEGASFLKRKITSTASRPSVRRRSEGRRSVGRARNINRLRSPIRISGRAEFRRKLTKTLLMIVLFAVSLNIIEEKTDYAPYTFITQGIIHLLEQLSTLEGEYTGTAKVTAYSCGGLTTEAEIRMNCPSLFNGSPKTYNGTTPIPYRTMACDKKYLGNVYFLEGIGKVTCTDTGGKIIGEGRFDLYLPTVNEAGQWGVRYVNYRLVED